MPYLKPDKVITEKIGSHTIKINQKITPNNARAKKNIASYIKKGDLVKPNRKLNNGTGKPKGITAHNTPEIKTSEKTNPAEQYARATHPNGNMGGVAVHYWVWKDVIWQQLLDSEQGWHAADGSRRRKDHRSGQTGGNVDTISIEIIGKDKTTENTAKILIAVLCKKHGLDPSLDVYTHNWWMHGTDKMVQGARKNCPLYILDRWPQFLKEIKTIYDGGKVSTNNTGGGSVTYYKIGDTGSGVKKLQEDLIELEYSFGKYGADSSFGPTTEEVVKQFQKDNKLTVDGMAGPATLAKIKTLLDEKNKPVISTDVYYRIRKAWNDAKSQKGAYKDLDNAIAAVKKHPGYYIFDENGNQVNYDDNADLLKRIAELEAKIEAAKKILE